MRWFFLVMIICFLSSCAFLNKLAPAQYDPNGNEIPFSRQPTTIVKTVADTVPYGNVVLDSFLLLAAGYARWRQVKTEKGLKATLLAGKTVASDPQLKEAWEKIKDEYRQAHENAGVTPLIKDMLAKLPSTAKS